MSDQPRTLSIALLCVVLAVMLQLGVATFLVYQEQQQLKAAIVEQAATLKEQEAVRTQLNSIVGKTLQLAQQGNANAATIIQQMQAAGFTINAGE